MPSGVLLPSYETGRWVIRGRLGESAAPLLVLGRWGKLNCIRPFTVTVAPGPGNVSGQINTCRLWVANSEGQPPVITAPANITGASPLGTDIVSPQTLEFDLPFEWIAAVILAGSNNTIIDLRAG